MLFSIIYSFDIPHDESVKPYLPPQRHKLWDMTEGDEQYQFGYLEGCWKSGKHRKFCAILNRLQFSTFLGALGLFSEDVETMGSLGAPGLGYGLAPAISFRSDHEAAILSAYVTPVPARIHKRGKPVDEPTWERIRRIVIDLYN